MGRPLVYYARPYLPSSKEKAEPLAVPVLLWEDASPEGDDLPLATEAAGEEKSRPERGQKLVYEVRKRGHKLNPFTFGVTVGRVDNNDIPIEDRSVSRFHAFLQESKKGWVLSDAESKNGTFLEGKRLQKGEKVVLKDGATIRFGEVEVRFYLPDSFTALVKRMLD